MGNGTVSDASEIHAIVPALAAFYIDDTEPHQGEDLSDSIAMIDLLLGMTTFYGGLNDSTEEGIRRILKVNGNASMSDEDARRCISMILRTGMLVNDNGAMLASPGSV